MKNHTVIVFPEYFGNGEKRMIVDVTDVCNLDEYKENDITSIEIRGSIIPVKINFKEVK
jgi:hypothetical protein